MSKVSDATICEIRSKLTEPDYKIYRDILFVFPLVDPTRKPGESLPVQMIVSGLRNVGRDYDLAFVWGAVNQMQESRPSIVTVQNSIFVQPTEVGEQLIAALHPEDHASFGLKPFPMPALQA